MRGCKYAGNFNIAIIAPLFVGLVLLLVDRWLDD
ncbi:type I toxin-antitoxin system Fst family toxin [Enterococcus raffinosus]|nr:type I toxin-antitoxin system Fst family toxin [Enterococcus raffinosus]MDT2531683.1 type I toxin-antitoxin system Fst family toxin [Enterococcus raffinosus]